MDTGPPPRLRIVLAIAVQPAQVAIGAPPWPRSSSLSYCRPRCELGRRQRNRSYGVKDIAAAAESLIFTDQSLQIDMHGSR